MMLADNAIRLLSILVGAHAQMFADILVEEWYLAVNATTIIHTFMTQKKSNMSKIKRWGLLFLTVLFAVACSKDDNNEPQPETKQGAPYLVTVLFSPGQLGDKGYADNVMEGVNALDDLDNLWGGDSIDVRFIAPRSMEDAQRWVSTSANLYSTESYERRLIVLTEPFMVDLLSLVNNQLLPTDEVLMLKMEEDDIIQVAQQYGLGNRVHGLNISVAAPTRRFCQYIHHWIENSGAYVPQLIQIPVYRLYETTVYPYRDGMMEAINQELGDKIEFVHIGLSRIEDMGIFMESTTQTMVESAFEAAQITQLATEASGCPFVLVDLGAGNAGWDYYLLSQAFGSSPLRTLMLDAQRASRLDRFYISRDFGSALEDWVQDWISKPAGAMARQVTHDDDNYYKDNIFDFTGQNE
jgi:hypothetical protein